MASKHKCFGIELETAAGETIKRAYFGFGNTDEEMQADAIARVKEKYQDATVKGIQETRVAGIGVTSE